MALAPGSVTYMDYGQRRPRVIHARLALALVEQDDWVILTPDHDMYVETLSAGNPDLQSFWVGPADGTLPAGVPAGVSIWISAVDCWGNRSLHGRRPG